LGSFEVPCKNFARIILKGKFLFLDTAFILAREAVPVIETVAIVVKDIEEGIGAWNDVV